jgi:hypothetical protein
MIHFDQTHGGQSHVDSIFIFFPNGLSCHTTEKKMVRGYFFRPKEIWSKNTVLHGVLVERLNKQLFGVFVVGQIQLWVGEGSVEPRFFPAKPPFLFVKKC